VCWLLGEGILDNLTFVCWMLGEGVLNILTFVCWLLGEGVLDNLTGGVVPVAHPTLVLPGTRTHHQVTPNLLQQQVKALS